MQFSVTNIYDNFKKCELTKHLVTKHKVTKNKLLLAIQLATL